VTLPKKQKMMLSQSIVNAVRSQTPSGRFLQKDLLSDLWYDVGDKRAQEKTSQALREGAAEIRTKLSQDGASTSATITTATSLTTTKTDSTDIAADNTTHTMDVEVIERPERSISSSTGTADEKRINSFQESTETAKDSDGCTAATITITAIATSTATATATSERTDFIDPTVLIPVPLGHATSKEQMPPPSTVPSSYVERNYVKRKQRSSLSSVLSLKHPPHNYADRYESHEEQLDDELSPLPLPLVPMPQPLNQEAHASCSFGSMALISDTDEARLLQSFTPSEYRNRREFDNQRDAYNTAATNQYPMYNARSEHRQTNRATYSNNDTQQPKSSISQQYYYDYPSQAQYCNNHNHHHYAAPYSPYYHDSNVGTYMPQQYQTQSPPPPPMQEVGIPQPVDGGLELNGFSIGSVMSIGTNANLEDAGLSFGSAMSYTPIPVQTNEALRKYDANSVQPPDSGLQDIGTSFGSMSIAEGDRERLIADTDRQMASLSDTIFAQNGPSDYRTNDTTNTFDATIPTTFFKQQKSRGSLLEGNDEDDDYEDSINAEETARRGAHQWNMLQKTLAMEDEDIRKVVPPMFALNSTSLRQQQPPPPPSGSNMYNYDQPTFDRDYSELSAYSMDEDRKPHGTTAVTSTSTISTDHYATDEYHYSNNNSIAIEHEPNWGSYETLIRQEVSAPPVHKSYRNNS
jgi:hypothetical protein